MSIPEKVREIAEPISEYLNYELVDVEYVKEGSNWFLRIYIDKPNGVNLDDCTIMSEKLSEVLDEKPENFIPQAYYLEVSSPGAEKPLNTPQALENAKGEYIFVKLYNQIGPENSFEGWLKEFDQEKIVLTVKDKTRRKDIEIGRDNISKARLAIEF